MMRNEQAFHDAGERPQWDRATTPARPAPCPVILEAVNARNGGAATRRVFRGRLHNRGLATVAVALDVMLPAPFLPSAPVLMQRLFTIAPGETLRVELGSTVGAAPGVAEVQHAARLRVA